MKRLALATAASATLLLVALGLWRWSSQPDLAAQLQPSKQQSQAQQPPSAQPQPNAREQATQQQPAAEQQSAQQPPPPSGPVNAQQQPGAQPQSAQQTPGPAQPRPEPRSQAAIANRQTIPLSQLGENRIREIQQALNQKGSKLAVDGKWGSRTRSALRGFNLSQNIAVGQALSIQTLSALGLDPASFGNETTGQASPAATGGAISGSPGAAPTSPARSNGGGT